jgi:hypothetical protein
MLNFAIAAFYEVEPPLYGVLRRSSTKKVQISLIWGMRLVAIVARVR